RLVSDWSSDVCSSDLAPGADDVRAGLTCELCRHRTDYAGRTVHEDALPRTKAAVLEQPLPRGQARHHEGRTHGEVNVARQRCERSEERRVGKEGREPG